MYALLIHFSNKIYINEESRLLPNLILKMHSYVPAWRHTAPWHRHNPRAPLKIQLILINLNKLNLFQVRCYITSAKQFIFNGIKLLLYQFT